MAKYSSGYYEYYDHSALYEHYSNNRFYHVKSWRHSTRETQSDKIASSMKAILLNMISRKRIIPSLLTLIVLVNLLLYSLSHYALHTDVFFLPHAQERSKPVIKRGLTSTNPSLRGSDSKTDLDSSSLITRFQRFYHKVTVVIPTKIYNTLLHSKNEEVSNPNQVHSIHQKPKHPNRNLKTKIRTYYINLPTQHTRAKYMKEHLSKFIVPSSLKRVIARTPENDQILTHDLISIYPTRPAELACIASHLYAINTSIRDRRALIHLREKNRRLSSASTTLRSESTVITTSERSSNSNNNNNNNNNSNNSNNEFIQDYAWIVEDDINIQFSMNFTALIDRYLPADAVYIQLYTSNSEQTRGLWEHYRRDAQKIYTEIFNSDTTNSEYQYRIENFQQEIDKVESEYYKQHVQELKNQYKQSLSSTSSSSHSRSRDSSIADLSTTFHHLWQRFFSSTENELSDEQLLKKIPAFDRNAYYQTLLQREFNERVRPLLFERHQFPTSYWSTQSYLLNLRRAEEVLSSQEYFHSHNHQYQGENNVDTENSIQFIRRMNRVENSHSTPQSNERYEFTLLPPREDFIQRRVNNLNNLQSTMLASMSTGSSLFFFQHTLYTNRIVADAYLPQLFSPSYLIKIPFMNGILSDENKSNNNNNNNDNKNIPSTTSSSLDSNVEGSILHPEKHAAHQREFRAIQTVLEDVRKYRHLLPSDLFHLD